MNNCCKYRLNHYKNKSTNCNQIKRVSQKTQEDINRRAVQKSCFKYGRSWAHHNGPAKGKICTKCRKPNHFAKICKSININVVNYENDNTSEYINSCDIPNSKTSMQNSKVQLQKFIPNIKICNVKVKFVIDT